MFLICSLLIGLITVAIVIDHESSTTQSAELIPVRVHDNSKK